MNELCFVFCRVRSFDELEKPPLDGPKSRFGGSGSLNFKGGLGGIFIGGPPALGCGFGSNVGTDGVGAVNFGVLVVVDNADGVANDKEGELDLIEAELADKDGDEIDGIEEPSVLDSFGVLNCTVFSSINDDLFE